MTTASGVRLVDVFNKALGHQPAEIAERVAFWRAQGLETLAQDQLIARAREAVVEARDADGQLIGIATAAAQRLPLLRQPMWVSRALVAKPARRGLLGLSLLREAKEILAADFERVERSEAASPEGKDHSAAKPRTRPIGIALLLENQRLANAVPDLVWPRTGFFYAGIAPNGWQRRLWYFPSARLADPGSGLSRTAGLPHSRNGVRNQIPPAGASPASFPESAPPVSVAVNPATSTLPSIAGPLRYDTVLGRIDAGLVADLKAFWQSQGGLPADVDAAERASQAAIVARDAAGAVAGVATSVVEKPATLGIPMSSSRAMVGRAHRGGRLLYELLRRGQLVLQKNAGLIVGAEQHGEPLGLYLELENEAFDHAWRQAVWPRLGFAYCGISPRGLEQRLWYRPGAKLPQS